MPKIDFKKDLNSEQYEVVTTGLGPHLVLAGAGSGKTRTLVYRAAWLIHQGVKPDKVLLLTFTNKAAGEMMARVRKILGLKIGAALPLWGGTFHAIANRLLRAYGKYIKVPSDFTILDEDDKKSLLKIISKDILGNLPDRHKPSPALISEVISFAVNSQVNLEESLEYKFPEWLPLLEYFEKVDKEYQIRKQNAKLFDFDDLLLKWRELTLEPRAKKILESKWEYILVDEYQDTNTLQAEIIFNLSQKHKNILVVGDDAQSIYSFRAANIQNILEFPEKFKNCQLHKLEINYRSTPEILDLANQLIIGSPEKFKKNLQAVKDNHIRPELVALRSNMEEAWFVVDKIQYLLSLGMRPNQIAVLFRAAHHSQTLEMELNRRGISYEMRGGLKFFERAHIKDVLAWLKILGNHRDEVAWSRVLQLYEGIGPVTAQLIYQRIMELNKIDDLLDFKLTLADKAASSWSRISELMNILISHKHENIGRLINLIIEHYGEYLEEHYSDYRQRQDDLDQLAMFASVYDSLELFLNEISLQENFGLTGGRNQPSDSVVLSTVHQAKGLEWPAVFVINLTNQSFPHPLAIREEEQAEERRLLYVAITRAENYLYLSYPLAIFRYDGYKNLQPSPFISELDSRLFRYNELASKATYAAQDGIEYVPDPDAIVRKKGQFLPDVDEW